MQYFVHFLFFIIKNASAFLPRRAWCKAPSLMRGCNPPCLSMRNNAQVEHCAAGHLPLRLIRSPPSFTAGHLLSDTLRSRRLPKQVTLRPSPSSSDSSDTSRGSSQAFCCKDPDAHCMRPHLSCSVPSSVGNPRHQILSSQ